MESNAVMIYDRLPLIPGPQLPRFAYKSNHKIEYLQLIGGQAADHDSDNGSYGAHGYVFKVRIGSKIYALKIFKFFDPASTKIQLGSRGHLVTNEEVIGQTDPFYAECRAYGRIASKPRKRLIAIPCHGFLAIEATIESALKRRFHITDWQRSSEDLAKPLVLRQPFRALVKDFSEPRLLMSNLLVKSMLRDLKALHSLKIYVMDIAARNYINGKLVDFSSSWTEPHLGFRLGLKSATDIRLARADDAYEFDEMVKELGIETQVRAQPSEKTIESLRPRTGR